VVEEGFIAHSTGDGAEILALLGMTSRGTVPGQMSQPRSVVGGRPQKAAPTTATATAKAKAKKAKGKGREA
jgi:hypothetical protein